MPPISSTSDSEPASERAERPEIASPALRTAFWSWLVILTVAVAAGSFVAVNYCLDPMGLFHSSGRRIIVYTNERWSKYLLSIRYVPEHFDAVLVGTSITANWNTGLMQPLQTYNLSLEGGNISEEGLLLENVLSRRRPKVVFFCIHPYLTASNGQKTPFMTRRDYWSALGSLELLKSYHAHWREELGMSRQQFNEFGREDLRIPASPWKARRMGPGDWYPVDERSVAEYGHLVAAARAAGSRVVAIVPPINSDSWLYTAEDYRQYQRRILSFFRGDELLIDFNDPRYEGLRRDRRSFPDGVHFSETAADTLVREVARLIHE